MMFRSFYLLHFLLVIPQLALATYSENENVLRRRGFLNIGKGTEKPVLTLEAPAGGWTLNQMIKVQGSCSDATANPIYISINGSRYYTRNQEGKFSRSFPAAKGKNTVIVECKNKGGTAAIKRTFDALIPSIGLKVILSNDTDGAYTDLHVYEPDGTHVYWLQTESSSGGKLFLNNEGGSFDQPGYGPYIYQNIKPLVGVYKIDANYWPGGAVQHTLGRLTIIANEGTANEIKKDIEKPLAKPGETLTIAYIVFKGNNQQPEIILPKQNKNKKEFEIPKEILEKWKKNSDNNQTPTNTEDNNLQLEFSESQNNSGLGFWDNKNLKKNYNL